MKIRWVGNVLVPPEKTARNIAHAKSLGLPEVSEAKRPALAVVGGGPSVAHHIQELRGWPGDIWVSGSAFPWAQKHGINSAFFTIDQSPVMAQECKGAARAVVATCCDPSVFEQLGGARVEVFDLHHAGASANHGATSATAAPRIALQMGYTQVHFFGCDSSFEAGATHAYACEPGELRMLVECGGKSYETEAGMLMQAEFLSLVLRSAPHVFVNRSDGLLKALVDAPGELDYQITHGNRALLDALGACKACGQTEGHYDDCPVGLGVTQ